MGDLIIIIVIFIVCLAYMGWEASKAEEVGEDYDA